MTELRIENWTMPGAEVGAENPLPPLEQGSDLHQLEVTDALPADMRENIGYGHLPNILPYTMQDGYTRQRRPMVFKVAVLENDILRAAFLLDYGGRMWSLLHKPTGRDLVRVNPVFQPANLALRNAWFSGGVEWNIGTIGHTPLTCSPMFAARVEGEDDTPILRLYEWERMRQVPYQLDFYLPDKSSVLYVFARIINPHAVDAPMYWWSNIAVPESVDTRVIVPAESAYRFDYRRTIEVLSVPQFDGVDQTYSTNTARAIDYFFHIPSERRHWIAALDHSGAGLAQFSTSRLQGRKLFLWGRGRGGTHWQNFLSKQGFPYIEIQAGLARTQLEHLRMPAHTEWTWLEGYGLVESDGAAAHGSDWQAAQQTVEQGIDKLIAPNEFDALYTRYDFNRAPIEILNHGAGWGTLERRRRELMNEPNFVPAALPFSDGALGKHQQAWLTLLETGRFPETDPDAAPLSYMAQREWRDLLETSLQNPANENWASWLHVGVTRYYAGEKEAARDAWQKSLEQHENTWALRNLAVFAQSTGSYNDAAELYLKAHKLKPTLRALTIETANALLKADRPQDCLTLIKALPAAERKHGRIRLLEAQAALAIGDIDRTARIFASQFVVDDIREGDTTLTDLWQSLYEHKVSRAEKRPIDDALRAEVRERYPLPDHYNFRMTE